MHSKIIGYTHHFLYELMELRGLNQDVRRISCFYFSRTIGMFSCYVISHISWIFSLSCFSREKTLSSSFAHLKQQECFLFCSLFSLVVEIWFADFNQILIFCFLSVPRFCQTLPKRHEPSITAVCVASFDTLVYICSIDIGTIELNRKNDDCPYANVLCNMQERSFQYPKRNQGVCVFLLSFFFFLV